MMLTRCPACQTVFRITPEQLKARQGRVRCGECRHVFNALDTLLDDAGSAPRQADETAPPAAFQGPQASAGALHAEPPAIPAPGGPPPEQPPAEPVPAGPRQDPDIPAPRADAPIPEPEPPSLPEEPPVGEEPAEGPAPAEGGATAGTASPREPLSAPATPLPTPEAALPEPPPDPAPQGGFDPDAAPFLAGPAAPRRRVWPWAVGTLAALLVLGAQAAHHFRVELAALAPEYRPLLVQACDALGCDIPLPRQAGLLGIESSDLHPDPERKSRLLLSASLRNRAPFAQALPHLEVTLTDTADQAVVRKVLPPEAYLPARQADEGIAPNGELPVALAIDAEGVAAAGYRLYIFYP